MIVVGFLDPYGSPQPQKLVPRSRKFPKQLRPRDGGEERVVKEAAKGFRV